jgi:citrate lyase subunit beta-like protein
MRARRALLYMPATDWRKIEKAAGLPVDTMCIDLEDGTALNRKAEGRETAVKALRELKFGSVEKLVRINGVDTIWAKDDIAAIANESLDGIAIPKVQSKEQLLWVKSEIQKHTSKKIPLVAVIESALGVVNLKEIASATDWLQALVFGAEDFAGDVGAVRTQKADEVFYARSAVVTHAAAYGLQAIDMLATHYKNPQSLLDIAAVGVQLGYVGTQIIHPNQIELAQQAYMPSAEVIEKAQAIVIAYKNHQQAGTGAFSMDGKMIDFPIVKAAENVLERAGMDK